MAKITGLFIYPVKSCAAISLNTAQCLAFGFAHDREWAVLSENGKVVTQRDIEKMALIKTAVSDANGGTLTLSIAPEYGAAVSPLMVSSATRPKSPERRPADVWGTITDGFDEGDEAAAWFSKFMGISVRLVRKNFADQRLTKITMPNGSRAPLTYFDSMPILVISEESLAELNTRLDSPVPMDRFRPSIVVSGLGAFAEDKTPELHVGQFTLHRGKPCARCVMTTIDQSTAEKRGPEPLRALSKFRQENDKVMFGQYFMPAGPGMISVGDNIQS
jgi:uncharacterized protein YcbX